VIDNKQNAHIGGLGNVIGMRGWNQLIGLNGEFTADGGTLSFSNGVFTYTFATGQVLNHYIYSKVVPNGVDGHKYFYTFSLYSNNTNVLQKFSMFNVTILENQSFTLGQWCDFNGVVTISNPNNAAAKNYFEFYTTSALCHYSKWRSRYT